MRLSPDGNFLGLTWSFTSSPFCLALLRHTAPQLPPRSSIMSSILLSSLIPAGSRSQGASTSMLKLPSRHVATSRLMATATSSCKTFGTFSPTASRRSDSDAKSAQSAQRIDEVEYLPTTFLGRALLTAGSALGLLSNPARGGKQSHLHQPRSWS